MPLFYQGGPSSDDPAADQAARARARPFRLVQIICTGDAVAGMLLHYLAPRLGVPGEVLGMPVLEFVGLALIVIGASGYVLFELLARAAMKRTDPPRPLR
ncbi:MAG: hypothetical protein IT563_15575 [Alphaproteobacteria bacterium]|nr:hypothetical protein [Alphaproteobacteria bacterium]